MARIEKTFDINGYEIQASYDERSVKELFLPLLESMRKLQHRKQRRIVVFLVAPPGAGKTTLSLFLETLSKETNGLALQAIGMDGFHHYQSYLQAHTMMRNQQVVNMVSLKGCIETFDHEKLRRKLMELTTEKKLSWPLYIRSLHNPMEDQVKVTSDIILLEGNYLLAKDKNWKDLKQYCDLSIFITTKAAFLKERLIARKMLGGCSKEEAITFYMRSDAYNVNYVLCNSQDADIVYEMDDEGNYHAVT